nr:hypothetical protein [Tanacetum cinerariifolium]
GGGDGEGDGGHGDVVDMVAVAAMLLWCRWWRGGEGSGGEVRRGGEWGCYSGWQQGEGGSRLRWPWWLRWVLVGLWCSPVGCGDEGGDDGEGDGSCGDVVDMVAVMLLWCRWWRCGEGSGGEVRRGGEWGYCGGWQRARCEETNLVFNWEKCHFMVKEGIILRHKISSAGIKVDKAKVDVIAKLPYPTNVKETKILSVLFKITPNLATRVIETPLSSIKGRMWCLCDPTPPERRDKRQNDRSVQTFKELPASRTLEKVLIREETRHLTTKNVNSISLIQMEEEKRVENNRVTDKSVADPRKSNEQEFPIEVDKMNEGNQRFNDSLSTTRTRKMKQKSYDLLTSGPVHDAILKKKINRKEDIGGNFEIPYNVGGLKHMNTLADHGSNVNIMPLSISKRLTDERHVEMDIRLSLASHSYIYPLGIANDVLVDIVGYVYLIDFLILSIREDEKRTFILGTPFLTTTNAVIKFDKGTITFKSGKSKMSFHMIPEPHCRTEKGIKIDIDPITPMMTVNRLV